MSSAWEDQTEVNIRERGGRRKQKPVRRPESRSRRLRFLFGTLRLERSRGLESHYGVLIFESRAAGVGGQPLLLGEQFALWYHTLTASVASDEAGGS